MENVLMDNVYVMKDSKEKIALKVPALTIAIN